jgi:hypothetical protein
VRWPAGSEVELPTRLRVHDSAFVPLAKWAMLLTGNYRCMTADGPQAIRDAAFRCAARTEPARRGLNLHSK